MEYNTLNPSPAWQAGYMGYGDIGFTTDQDYADYRAGRQTRLNERGPWKEDAD